MYTIVYTIAREFNQYTIEEREQYLKYIEKMCNIEINKEKNISNQLWLLLDRVAGIYGGEECTEVTYLPTNICYNKDFKFKRNGLREQKDCHLRRFQFLCQLGMMKYLSSNMVII